MTRQSKSSLDAFSSFPALLVAATLVACSSGSDATGTANSDNGRSGSSASAGSSGSKTSSPSGSGSSGAADGGVVPAGWNGDCGLHTQWAGDDRCIMPPPPDKGFQVHVGPKDYANPESTYVMQPNTEATNDFNVVSPNQDKRYFYFRQYRMRPTAHHMILTAADASTTATVAGTLGHRIATANASGDFPVNGIIAPENAGVGSPIGAHSNIDVSLHSINAGGTAQLREIWVNFWYKDAKDVTDPATPWFDVGDPTFSIAPGQDTVLGPYTCSIASPGRLLWLYGHRHANNVGFVVTRIRGSQRDLVYAGYHWNEPITLQYDSITKNAAADPPANVEGGWSGILDLKAGDKIEWSCHVINHQSSTLRFTNQTYLGEMCIVDAEAVGTNCM